jgi:hypothetical protein
MIQWTSATITFLSDSSGRRTTFNGQSVYTQPSTPNAQPVTSDHTTVQALRFDASDNAMGGQLKTVITLGNLGVASSIRTTWELTVVDVNTVRLTYDANNDGIVESSHDFSWAEIRNVL